MELNSPAIKIPAIESDVAAIELKTPTTEPRAGLEDLLHLIVKLETLGTPPAFSTIALWEYWEC